MWSLVASYALGPGASGAQVFAFLVVGFDLCCEPLFTAEFPTRLVGEPDMLDRLLDRVLLVAFSGASQSVSNR